MAASLQAPEVARRDWHALEPTEALERLASSRRGLSGEEAQARLARFGPNRLPPPKRRGPIRRFLLQFHNVLIYVLLAAALVTLLMGHVIDSGVILAVVLINAIVGFIQEGRAETALDAIRDMLAPHAAVLRDGHRVGLAAEDLVPGDVVLLEPGDRVPADLRILQTRGLMLDEAVLTGESVPVEKTETPAAAEAALGDRLSLAFSGTLVTSGQGQGVVVATGTATEIGRISGLIAETTPIETPLLRKLGSFAQWLTLVILVATVAISLFGVYVRGLPWDEMLLAAVGLAVSSIPESLPAIMTIALAIGVQRMARRRAIVRRLPAVETLGSVTVICSDKTGTLTRNEMMVERVALTDRVFEVVGEGYAPVGRITGGGETVRAGDEPRLIELARAALLCNDAALQEHDGVWRAEGDPMEAALVALAMKLGFAPETERGRARRTDAIPFDSAHRYMASLNHDRDGKGLVYLKGAPERLLEMCDLEAGPDGPVTLDIEAWYERMAVLAGSGYRLLALASRRAQHGEVGLRPDRLEDGLVLLGIVALADPPREEAMRAIRTCREAGIRVIMITGDHAATALAIAGRLGLDIAAGSLTGAELEELSPEELADRADTVNVFARTSPEDKLKLVQALQAHGEVVAMTGDGVNDAPALKRADVGVAMGAKGTEAAKEASEIVLADDNFASIANAVEEGRTVYDNLRKAILHILPTNGGEALVIVAAILFGFALPVTPVQILWVNMVTTVALALALAFEPVEPDVMDLPPRHPAAPLLDSFLISRIILVSTVQAIGVFGMFLIYRDGGTDLAFARTVAVNMLVAFEAVYLFNCRHLVASALNLEAFTGNRVAVAGVAATVVLQLAFTYLPPMQLLFDTRPIGITEWALVLVIAAALFLIVEAEKAIRRRALARSRPA